MFKLNFSNIQVWNDSYENLKDQVCSLHFYKNRLMIFWTVFRSFFCHFLFQINSCKYKTILSKIIVLSSLSSPQQRISIFPMEPLIIFAEFSTLQFDDLIHFASLRGLKFGMMWFERSFMGLAKIAPFHEFVTLIFQFPLVCKYKLVICIIFLVLFVNKKFDEFLSWFFGLISKHIVNSICR